MRLTRPTERRLYQQVADQIRALIHGGDLAVGDRLPGERELALQLGVSRPSLREALIALEIEGIVEVRMGSGVYVLPAPQGRRLHGTSAVGESPLVLMGARIAIEGAVVALAVARFTDEALQSLRDSLRQMRLDIEGGRNPIEHDRQFHITIAGQTGNDALRRIVTELFDERHSPIFSRFRIRFESRATWTGALLEHEAILAAIEARDALVAQAAMQLHLEQSRRRWLESEPPAPGEVA